MRHSLRETWSGLKRNLAMTIAVIVTMGVSLSLLGAGLLTSMEVDLAKRSLYDKIEISVFLCTENTQGGRCEAGKATTEAQREQIQATLEANPEVSEVLYESKEAAFEEFQRVFADSPVVASRTAEDMQDSFRVSLVNPENYEGVVSEARGLQGVQNVQDLHTVLEPMFKWLAALQWATITMSVLLLLAASLQIANTIRMAAFTRRREIGIMRLVGASRWYTQLPFLLEAVVAATIGVILAIIGLVVVRAMFLDKALSQFYQANLIAKIDYADILYISPILFGVGVVMAAATGYVTLRWYVRR